MCNNKKICSFCGENKDLELFHKSSVQQYGRKSRCRDCVNLYRRLSAKKDKRELNKFLKKSKIKSKNNIKLIAINKQKNNINSGHKECNRCHSIKKLNKFGKRKVKFSISYRSYCKECEHFERNSSENGKKYKSSWYKNNKVRINKKDSKIRKTESYKKKRRVYLKKYYKENSHIYLWRTLVYRTVIKKDENTFKLLGYSYNELKFYLEKLFLPGMSWNNYGEWHVDHIKPLHSFSKNEKVSVVNALSNLQPLWATTREINGIIYEGNLNKGKRYD